VNVPNALSLLRLLSVPVLLAFAWSGHSRIYFYGLLAALLTDALDGWIARTFKQTSELGARLDSWADLFMSLSLPLAGWWLRPDVVRAESAWLIAALGFYVAPPIYGWFKFRRLPSYHTWAAKTAAVVVALAVLVIFGGGPGWCLRLALPLVMAACLEEILITTVLRAWQSDVPTLWHALRRQGR
jgi:phosphatidylglycerophosphate synthase